MTRTSWETVLHPFVRKLRFGARLTAEDEEALSSLTKVVRCVHAKGDIVLEGDAPRSIALVLDGWAYSYRELENGRRQIISVLLPGDLTEPFGALPTFMAHSLGALTPVTFAQVSPDAIRAAARSSPTIEEALWWDLLAFMTIEREHVVSLGRRSAVERLGHFFCELQLRLSLIGLAEDGTFDFPVTQTNLGDILGLSSVHVNRSIQYLRARGLVSLRAGRLIIHDVEELRAASYFDPAFLKTSEAPVGDRHGAGF